jgi:hypothetical protein
MHSWVYTIGKIFFSNLGAGMIDSATGTGTKFLHPY